MADHDEEKEEVETSEAEEETTEETTEESTEETGEASAESSEDDVSDAEDEASDDDSAAEEEASDEEETDDEDASGDEDQGDDEDASDDEGEGEGDDDEDEGDDDNASNDEAQGDDDEEGDTASEDPAEDEAEDEDEEDEAESPEAPGHHMGKQEPVESDYPEIKSDDPIPADERPSADDVLPDEPTDGGVHGVAAFFDHPLHLTYAAEETRDSDYDVFDAFSPFPIHGMDDAMGLGRSWIPWVTFFAGLAGFLTACGLQFGIMVYDWPMVFGGKPFAAWPSFVPIMFELTVLFAGVTTAVVMLKAAGCFKKPLIIDKGISSDRFVLWISADDKKFEREGVIEFMKDLNPVEIRTIKKDQ